MTDPYSTTNPYVDVVAPGGAGSSQPTSATEILTTSHYQGGEQTGEYAVVAGTSFASPYVAGLAALVRAVAPDATPAQIESVLESTAVDLGDPGRDQASGWGLVQAAAVSTAAGDAQITGPEPDPEFPVGDVGGGVRPGGPIDVSRVSVGNGTTEPVTQAVAVSQSVFADAGTPDGRTANWAVLSRGDDYADALAGSSLTLGTAPLLYTGSTGALAAPTAAELTRTLAPGSTVYVLGGGNAIPDSVNDDIAALGFTPVRLAGPVRENTAVAVADEVDRLLVDVVGATPSPVVLLVNRDNWPDAIAAGQLGAQFGYPVLLTPPDALAPQTAAALAARDVQQLIVVGGTVRVSDATMQAAATEAGLSQAPQAVRLAGEDRNGTVVAVSAAVENILSQTPLGAPANALVVNVRRADAYSHMLSATVPIAAFTGVFVPVEGDDGTSITDEASAYATGLGLPTALMGGEDLIPSSTGATLETLIETTP